MGRTCITVHEVSNNLGMVANSSLVCLIFGGSFVLFVSKTVPLKYYIFERPITVVWKWNIKGKCEGKISVYAVKNM